MKLFDKLYLDDDIKAKKSFISNISKGNFKKNYFVLLYDFNSTETFDIICASHIASLKNKDDIVLVGVTKTKESALLQAAEFFQDIIDAGYDLMEINFDEYILSNSNKE